MFGLSQLYCYYSKARKYVDTLENNNRSLAGGVFLLGVFLIGYFCVLLGVFDRVFLWISADFCGFLWISADFCGFPQGNLASG